MFNFILSSIIFIIIIVLLIILRKTIGKKVEIKNTDLFIATIIIVLYLILTGKISKLEFGQFKLEAAFFEASKTDITKQITQIEHHLTDEIEIGAKADIREISKLIELKTEAISFYLGKEIYYGPAIGIYLRELSKHPFFKYIILLYRHEEFYGMADGRELNSLFQTYRDRYWDSFTDAIAEIDRFFFEEELPGFISYGEAITIDTS
ncbi:unnamed protein product, partial [marine sediment metagenome]